MNNLAFWNKTRVVCFHSKKSESIDLKPKIENKGKLKTKNN